MSRSGYSDDLDQSDLAMWRGQVASAIRGKRGQKFLKDLMAALDAMPNKILITDELQNDEGDVCAIGALGKARNVDMSKLDPSEHEDVATAFNIARQLAMETVYVNDDGGYYGETPGNRWKRVREWVAARIKSEVGV